MTVEENKKTLMQSDLKSLIERFSKDDVISGIDKNYQRENVKYLSCDDIVDNSFIKDAKIDKETIKNIEKSIIERGIYNPLIVREYKKGKYEVIIGRKRWIASKKLDYKKIPVIIKNYDDQETLLILLCDARENKNFNPIEIALVIKHLADDFNYKKKDIAEILHVSSGQVSNYLSLLNMPKDVIYDISTNRLSFGHAKAISRLKEKDIKSIIKKIYDYSLSVRDTEKLAFNLEDKNVRIKKEYVIRKKNKSIIVKINNEENFNKIYKKINELLKKEF